MISGKLTTFGMCQHGEGKEETEGNLGEEQPAGQDDVCSACGQMFLVEIGLDSCETPLMKTNVEERLPQTVPGIQCG